MSHMYGSTETMNEPGDYDNDDASSQSRTRSRSRSRSRDRSRSRSSSRDRSVISSTTKQSAKNLERSLKNDANSLFDDTKSYLSETFENWSKALKPSYNVPTVKTMAKFSAPAANESDKVFVGMFME